MADRLMSFMAFKVITPPGDSSSTSLSYAETLHSRRMYLRTISVLCSITDQIQCHAYAPKDLAIGSGSSCRDAVWSRQRTSALGPKSCGNTIARLLRNLQAHVGSDISLHLPERETGQLAS